MNREAIYAALWDRLSEVRPNYFLSRSRRPRHVQNTPPTEQPAMFLEQQTSTATGEVGFPSKHQLRSTVLVYLFSDTLDGPYPEINAIVAEIEDVLRARAGEEPRFPGATTLGGAVHAARVVEVNVTGEALGAQGIAAIDIEMATAG